jgi:MOSC domain-containing protein YiiM
MAALPLAHDQTVPSLRRHVEKVSFATLARATRSGYNVAIANHNNELLGVNRAMTETTQAEIASITYKPQHVDFTPPERYSRLPLEQANLVEGYGIEGDRKGGHPKRQINLMSAETLEELGAEGCQVAPGEMGEQIVVRGLDVNQLAAGTLLKLGSMVVLEVLKPRTGCERLEHIQGVDREQLSDRLGMMASVVRGGMIRLGDPVKVVQTEEVYV